MLNEIRGHKKLLENNQFSLIKYEVGLESHCAILISSLS